MITTGQRPAPASRWAVAGLGILVVWLFRETLFAPRVFYKRDILLVWYPQVEAFVRAVASGAWPLWNPNLAFGEPLMADPHAQILYPLTWLNLLLRPWHYYTVYAVLHVLLAAWGTYALARHWRLSAGASSVAAAIFVLSGPYISCIDLWHHLASLSWMPIVVLAADRALATRGFRPVLLWALAQVGQALAGSVELCTFTFLFVAGLVLVKHWRYGWRPLALNRPVVQAGLSAVAITVGLTAIMWIPAVEIASRSGRWALSSAVRTYWSTHPLVLMETLIPGLWSDLPLSRPMRSLLFESREPYMASLYLGVPALGLVAAAFAGDRHPLRGLLGFFGVVGLFVALGHHTGAYDLVTLLVPPLRIVRYPVKIVVLTAFCWSMLAGLGFDAWRGSSGPLRKWTIAVVGPLALLALLDSGLALLARFAPETTAAPLLDVGPSGPALQAVLRPAVARLLVGAALAMAGVALAVARARRPSAAPTLAAVLGVLAVAELAVYHRHPNPAGPLALVTYRPEVLTSLAEAGSRIYVYDYSAPDQAKRPAAPLPGYVLARQPEGWTPDEAFALAMQMYVAPETAGRWGLRSSYQIDYRGLAPPVLDSMTHLLRYVEGQPELLRLLRIGNVTHVVSLHEQGYGDLSLVRTLPGLFTAPIHVFRVPSPLPRTYVVGQARVADGVEAVTTMLAQDFDPEREVVLERPSRAVSGVGFQGTSRVVAERADRVEVEADLSGPGYVVLVEAYDPGWRATVDGLPAPVLRANGAFRAVAAPAGRHVIDFVFRPRSVALGLAISLGTALAVTCLGLWKARGRAATGLLPTE